MSYAGARAVSSTTVASTPTLRAVDEYGDDDERPSDGVWLTIAIVVPLLVLWLWVTRLP